MNKLYLILICSWSTFLQSQTNDASPYCGGATFGNSDSQIRRVSIANFSNQTNNASLSSTYTYFNNIETVNLVNGVNPISVIVNRADCQINSLLVFIDLNENYGFEIDELVGQVNQNQIQNTNCDIMDPPFAFNFNLNIPNAVTVLNTRMRIIFSNVDEPNLSSCANSNIQNFLYGEIEDYNVSVGANLTNNKFEKGIIVFYNPVTKMLNLKYDIAISKIKIYDYSGRLVQSIDSNSQLVEMNLNSLTPSIYVLNIFSTDNTIQRIKILIK